MKCEICNQGPPDGPAIYRVNELGVKGVWRCQKHLTNNQALAVDPEVRQITEIIEHASERTGE